MNPQNALRIWWTAKASNDGFVERAKCQEKPQDHTLGTCSVNKQNQKTKDTAVNILRGLTENIKVAVKTHDH